MTVQQQGDVVVISSGRGEAFHDLRGEVVDGAVAACLDRLARLVDATDQRAPSTFDEAVGHGGRRDIVEAATSLIRSKTPADEVTERLFADHLPFPDTPDVDLVIRTSGEQRISNFMLWQVTYAEWVFPRSALV